MKFVLAGFRQFDNIRRYYFAVTEEGRLRKRVAVSADLNLIHRHGVPLQELPLLCRRLLEASATGEAAMFTESDMVHYVNERTAAETAATDRRRRHHPPSSVHAGDAWRRFPILAGKR